jgi:hypothetical protein
MKFMPFEATQISNFNFLYLVKKKIMVDARTCDVGAILGPFELGVQK